MIDRTALEGDDWRICLWVWLPNRFQHGYDRRTNHLFNDDTEGQQEVNWPDPR